VSNVYDKTTKGETKATFQLTFHLLKFVQKSHTHYIVLLRETSSRYVYFRDSEVCTTSHSENLRNFDLYQLIISIFYVKLKPEVNKCSFFWDITPCSGNTFLRNVHWHSTDYMALYPKRKILHNQWCEYLKSYILLPDFSRGINGIKS
jgi:hypothetical protein